MDARDLFEILVREHSPMLNTYLRAALRDPSAIDDIFQETFLTAWRRIDSFDRTRPFGPWLRGIARNLLLAHYRTRARAHAPVDAELLLQIEARLGPIERSPGDSWDARLEGLRGCVAGLGPQAGKAIHLHYWQRLDLKQVAQELDVSWEAAKKRLQRARSALLDCMRRKYPVAGEL